MIRFNGWQVLPAVDILEYGGFGLVAGFPNPTTDQFGHDGFEERLDNSIAITIPPAAH